MTNHVLQQVEDERVEALMTCFILSLYEEFGFGKDQCLQALNRIDNMMEAWIRGEVNIEELKQRAEDKVAIRIKC